jgi:predicted PurR-regulated permease PerM
MRRPEEFQRVQTIALFAVILGVGWLFVKMIAPYLFPLFWAAVIAALFHPAYERLLERVKRPSIASLVTVFIVIFVVMLPLSIVVGLIVDQAIDTVAYVSDPNTVDKAQQIVERFASYPYVDRVVADLQIVDRVKEASSTIAQWGFQQAGAVTRNTVQMIVGLFIMLYSLYFFLKDGPGWLRRFMELLPFGDDNEAVLYNKFVSTARATLKGTMLIGVVQGAIGGALLWATDVPSAAFWGVIMVLLSIIPAVGPALVLVPIAIFFVVTMAWWQAVVIVVGMLVIGVVDNVLRPPLVGKDLQMHPVLILFSTIGGLAMFGISGVVIGPMIAAFLFALLQMYEVKYKKQLEEQG